MGLDMYLYRKVDEAKDFETAKTMEEAFWDNCHWNKEAGRYDSRDYGRGFEKIGYWRKANMVHNWFVENCGADNGEYYPVKREQLEDLLIICHAVLANTVLEKGMVQNGERLVDGKWEPIMEEGEFIADSSVAEELLPTCEGFFFGNTNYDQWYVQDVEDTVEIVRNVLNDYDDAEFYYYPSW